MFRVKFLRHIVVCFFVFFLHISIDGHIEHPSPDNQHKKTVRSIATQQGHISQRQDSSPNNFLHDDEQSKKSNITATDFGIDQLKIIVAKNKKKIDETYNKATDLATQTQDMIRQLLNKLTPPDEPMLLTHGLSYEAPIKKQSLEKDDENLRPQVHAFFGAEAIVGWIIDAAGAIVASAGAKTVVTGVATVLVLSSSNKNTDNKPQTTPPSVQQDTSSKIGVAVSSPPDESSQVTQSNGSLTFNGSSLAVSTDRSATQAKSPMQVHIKSNDADRTIHITDTNNRRITMHVGDTIIVTPANAPTSQPTPSLSSIIKHGPTPVVAAPSLDWDHLNVLLEHEKEEDRKKIAEAKFKKEFEETKKAECREMKTMLAMLIATSNDPKLLQIVPLDIDCDEYSKKEETKAEKGPQKLEMNFMQSAAKAAAQLGLSYLLVPSQNDADSHDNAPIISHSEWHKRQQSLHNDIRQHQDQIRKQNEERAKHDLPDAIQRLTHANCIQAITGNFSIVYSSYGYGGDQNAQIITVAQVIGNAFPSYIHNPHAEPDTCLYKTFVIPSCPNLAPYELPTTLASQKSYIQRDHEAANKYKKEEAARKKAAEDTAKAEKDAAEKAKNRQDALDKSKQAADDRYNDKMNSFKNEAAQANKNFDSIQQQLAKKGIELQDHLLPTDRAGFRFKPMYSKDGRFLRNEKGIFFSADGSKWTYDAVTNTFDAEVLNGSKIVQIPAQTTTSTTIPEIASSIDSARMIYEEPEKPESQGCGDWQEANKFPTILISPTPEIKMPENEGCGKPDPFLQLPDALPGCGKPDPSLEEIKGKHQGCGGMSITEPRVIILKAWIASDGKTRSKGDLSDIDVKFKEKNKEHIFDDRKGHLKDTLESRERIIKLVKDPTKYLGPDSRGNWWYGEILPDGTQLWGSVWGEVIGNCGLNEIPKEYNPNSGLCDFDPTKQKK